MHQLPVTHDEDVQGREGEWSRLARGNQTVTVAWKANGSGREVKGTVATSREPGVHHFELSLDHAHCDARTLELGDIDVTLTLTRPVRPEPEVAPVALICNLPLTESSFFNRAIGVWQAERPVPDDDDVPEDEYALKIEGPHDAVDLFPFVWLHPPGRRELADMARNYVTVEACGLRPEELPLYTQLAAETGAGAADAKRKDAAAFRDKGCGTARYVDALDKLPPPLKSFPRWREVLETLPLWELEEYVVALLPESIEEFLADKDMLAALANVWQTLFALALVGTPADARLAVQLTDVLRVWHFLQLLAARCERELDDESLRRQVLDARPVFPDEVTAYPPAPTIAGPQGGSAGGSWEVLGVGTVKTARQRLVAYVPGELAEVVNVMPRERQEVQSRFAASTHEHASGQGEHEVSDNFTRQSLATTELTDAVQEAMAADGALRNLSNVTPAYNNLNLILSGASAEGRADSKWSGQDATRFMRQLTEQAARRLGERVSRQRGAVWHEFRERRQSNLIDNAGNGRLVGLYRWVDQLMRLHMAERGRRLVLSFLVAQPAAAWLARVAGQGALPLQEPQPLAAFKVPAGQGYTQITAANYQGFGAQYGLCEMVPPPRQTLALCATFDRVGAAEASGLRIPDGYSATAGQVTIGLADSRYNLACSVAGQVYTSQGTQAPQITLDTKVPVSNDKATTIDDAIVKPPVTPTATVVSQALKQIAGVNGAVAVTVMTAAPAFVVQLHVQCQRGDDATDPDYVAWQITTYARLLRAYEEACSSYAKELGARIEAASAGRTGEVQRKVLRQACLELLAPDGSTHPEQFRALAPLLSWDAMSWHYEPWQVGEADAWPEAAPAETTEPSSERLFRQFLRAPSARVLLPVAPGSEEWLLFYLQYGIPWTGGPATTPVSRSCMLLLAEIREPERVLVRTASGALERMPTLLAPERLRGWTVRVPTSMLYLQAGAALPRFPAHSGAAAAEGCAE